MTQFQFDLICKILDQGAPVLSGELCGALNTLVLERNALVAENEQLKEQINALTAIPAEDKNLTEEAN